MKTASFDPRGLTAAQVQSRVREGRVNRVKNATSKPLARIFIDNLLTPFNLVNFAIAVALFAVGSYHNLLFFGVVLCNSIVGIVQEWRTKRTLEKLSLLCAVQADVMRDGVRLSIPVEQLVEGDVFFLRQGDQIAVDATVVDGTAEADESLLTGESDPVCKHVGDELLSGSFLVSGSLTARATRVGEDSYAAHLAADAKKHKRSASDLLRSVNTIIRFTSLFMLPFAAALIARDCLDGTFAWQKTVTSTASALIGMMPQGLILLTTVALMVGVIKLARKQTLVRELYGIETLSRVSLLCLDKTGTLTTGAMRVCEIVPLSNTSVPTALSHLSQLLQATDDRNATAAALRQYCDAHATDVPPVTVRDTRPFSSDRKWSAAAFEEIGCVFLGAPDRLLPQMDVPHLEAFENDGKRVLLAAVSRESDIDNALHSLTPLALVVLEEDLRESAADTVAYFQNEDVTLRILSGDHPRTVAAVAKRAGVQNADCFVDATTLTTPESLKEAAARYTVFGRVTPQQKRELVRCFQEIGHTVAMTGDGVNDVPALKAADCSIAMATGSDAAKAVAGLVLLHSDFAALPAVVTEGRRVINNITRTASLFLVKTVMSFLVTLAAILTPMAYPFEPLQLTLIGIFAESVPGFILTLEPDNTRIRGNFLKTVLKNAVPSGVLITAFVMLVQLFIAPLLHLESVQSSTLCIYITGFVWLLRLLHVCRPLTPLRRALCAAMTVGFFGSALLLSHALPALFTALGYTVATVFALPTAPMLTAFSALAVLSFPLDAALSRLFASVPH